MLPKLKETVELLEKTKISEERKLELNVLVDYIQGKINNKESITLNFICTHNSRRSHLSQIWAQTMAYYFNVKNIFCYSGGTEATAMFPKVTETLIQQGFNIEKLSTEQNPIYAIKFDENQPAIIGFSKKYDATFNPKNNFAAILTCSSADEGCPIILGANIRVPIRYEDPKKFDDTNLMDQKYRERSLEIASELCFVFSQIKNN